MGAVAISSERIRSFHDPDQPWLDSLVGKRVLVGLAWEGIDGAVTQRAQFYGTITTATPEGRWYDNPDLVCAMRLTPGQAGPAIERDVD